MGIRSGLWVGEVLNCRNFWKKFVNFKGGAIFIRKPPM